VKLFWGEFMATLEKTFTLSSNDYIKSSNQYFSIAGKHRIGINIFSIITNLFFGTLMVVSKFPMGWFFLVMAILLIAYLSYVRYFWLVGNYNKDPNLKKHFTIQLDNIGLKSVVCNASSYFEWSYFEKVVATEQFYFLIYNKDNSYILPNFIFSESEREIFKQILKENNLQLIFWGNS
jgi:hypothetical protein